MLNKTLTFSPQTLNIRVKPVCDDDKSEIWILKDFLTTKQHQLPELSVPILDGIKSLPARYLLSHTLEGFSAEECALPQSASHQDLFPTETQRASVTKSATAR